MSGHEAAEQPLDDEEWKLLVGQHWQGAVAALQSIKEAINLEGFMVKVLDTGTTEPLVGLFAAVKGFPVPTSHGARLVRRRLELASDYYMAAAKELQEMARYLHAGANKAIADGGFRGRLALTRINSRSKKAQTHLQQCFTKFGQVAPFFE